MKNRLKILIVLLFTLLISTTAQTSKFARSFVIGGSETEAAKPLLGASIYLVPQAYTYPSGAIQLIEHSTRKGYYYTENLPDGEYKIYLNIGSGLELFEEHIWIGSKRLTDIADIAITTNNLADNETDPHYNSDKPTILFDSDFNFDGIMISNGDGTYNTIANNATNWDAAYNWGNHANQNYLDLDYYADVDLDATDDLTASSNVTYTGVFQFGAGGGFRLPAWGGTSTGDIRLNSGKFKYNDGTAERNLASEDWAIANLYNSVNDFPDNGIDLTKLDSKLLVNHTLTVPATDPIEVDISSYSFTDPTVVLTNKCSYQLYIKTITASTVTLGSADAVSGNTLKFDLLILEK